MSTDDASTVDTDKEKNKDANEDQTEKLLEDKRCAICQEVMVNACRVSCGHEYCRQCVDNQLSKIHPEGRHQRCAICDAKIDEIQNCPELDKEINTWFSRLSTEKQLQRAAVKATKKRNKEEKPSPPAPSPTRTGNPPDHSNSEQLRSGTEPSNRTSTFDSHPEYEEHQFDPRSIYSQPPRRDSYEREHGVYLYPTRVRLQDNPPGFIDDDIFNGNLACSRDNDNAEDSDDSIPPLLVHETLTFHRTSVLNSGTADYSNRNGIPDQTPFYMHQRHQPPPPIPYYCSGPYGPPQCPHCPPQPYIHHPCPTYPCRYSTPIHPGYHPGHFQPQVPENPTAGPILTDYSNFPINEEGYSEYYAYQDRDRFEVTVRDITSPSSDGDEEDYSDPWWQQDFRTEEEIDANYREFMDNFDTERSEDHDYSHHHHHHHIHHHDHAEEEVEYQALIETLGADYRNPDDIDEEFRQLMYTLDTDSPDQDEVEDNRDLIYNSDFTSESESNPQLFTAPIDLNLFGSPGQVGATSHFDDPDDDDPDLITFRDSDFNLLRHPELIYSQPPAWEDPTGRVRIFPVEADFNL